MVDPVVNQVSAPEKVQATDPETVPEVDGNGLAQSNNEWHDPALVPAMEQCLSDLVLREEKI